MPMGAAVAMPGIDDRGGGLMAGAKEGGGMDFGGGVPSQDGGMALLGTTMQVLWPLQPGATNSLYLDSLPADLNRREAAHIFRPYQGFVVRVWGRELGSEGEGARREGRKGRFKIICWCIGGTGWHMANTQEMLHIFFNFAINALCMSLPSYGVQNQETF